KSGETVGVLRATGKMFRIKDEWLNDVFDAFDLFILKFIADLFTRFLDTIEFFGQLKSTYDRLQLAEKIRTHEVTAPLAAITANASFVEKHLHDRGVTSKKRRLNEIISDAEICAFLLRESRIPAREQFDKGLRYLSVHKLLREVESFLKRQIAARSEVKIKDRGEQTELEFIPTRFMKIGIAGSASRTMVHRLLLQRAFYNLGINAVKYGVIGGGLEMKLSEDTSSNEVVIDFVDDGIGVNSAETKRIFQEGERGSNVPSTSPGEGLGLGISRAIFEAHGGTLELVQNKNPTIFRCRLPVRSADRDDDSVENRHSAVLRMDRAT
ncbi:MAG: HAMP domain-containing sensor histidine kinase, partial [Verrucomicrobiota bacterium]